MRWKNSLVARNARRFWRRFTKRDDGAVAVEIALCSAWFVLLVTGFISVGSIVFVKANMADTARDAVRRMAVGELSVAQAQTFAQNQLVNLGMVFTVNASNDGTDAAIEITVPMAQAAVIDYLGMFSGTLRSSVIRPLEAQG